MKPEGLEDKPNHAVNLWRPLEGHWIGRQRFWPAAGEAPLASESQANVGISEDGRQVEIDYDWIHDERRQTALLSALLRGTGKAEVRWSDTFHTMGARMKLKGSVSPTGRVSVRVTYTVERGPDWGWRIDLHPTGPRSFQVLMYNVDAKGKETLSVEALYRREGVA